MTPETAKLYKQSLERLLAQATNLCVKIDQITLSPFHYDALMQTKPSTDILNLTWNDLPTTIIRGDK